ncbi:DUF2057 domain-containing protein [Motilimonas sp. E26]|nr:DUF2057 domain-containing protein [Motilimonas sp. E26]
MRIWLKMVTVGLLTVSFSSLAKVEVNLKDDVNVLVINGEEVGFRLKKLSTLQLDNGFNQIVVRVAKLVTRYGEYEKFNSDPVVISFNAADQKLDVGVEDSINTVEQAEAFNQNSAFIIQSAKGIDYKQDKLPLLGGISRDYAKELNAYNRKNDITVAGAAQTALNNNTVQSNTQSAPVRVNSTAVEMVRYWYNEAGKNEQKAFEDWAFSNRVEVKQPLISDSKPLEMLAYWYAKADKADKSSILSWLLNK